MPINSTCPNCNSKATQNVRTLIQQGTTKRRTTGVAMGGLGKRRGGGVHTSTSITKTRFVDRFVPPQRPVGLHYLFFIALGAGLCLSIVGAIAGVPLIRYGWRKMKEMPNRVEAWRKDLHRFYSLWVCKKCGHEWVPGEDEESQQSIAQIEAECAKEIKKIDDDYKKGLKELDDDYQKTLKELSQEAPEI